MLLLRAFVSLGLFLLLSVATASAQQGIPDGALRVRPVQIMDNTGFGRPMVAGTIMIPAGWQTQGGINWEINNAGCGKNNPHSNWVAYSSDGLGMISLLPDETWSGNNQGIQNGQCPNVTVTDTKQAILAYIQQYRPNAQVLQYFDRTAEVQHLMQGVQPVQQDAYGNRTRRWLGAGQAVIGYQVNGQDVEELIGTGIVFTQREFPGGVGFGTQQYLTLNVLPGYAMRMPAGQLDLKQAELIRKSNKPNPQWEQLMAQHRAKIAGINNRGAMERSRITAQTSSEILDMQHRGFQNRQKIGDRLQRETIESVRGVETYNNPGGDGSVQLDNTYKHAWRLDNGDYVLTDDPSFQPFGSLGIDGQKLEQTQ